MMALSLRKLVADALADVGVSTGEFSPIREKPRETIWYSMESGFGMRRYASGRYVYIVQTRMSGRLRTVTIGPSSLISRTAAASVARRVIAHALSATTPPRTASVFAVRPPSTTSFRSISRNARRCGSLRPAQRMTSTGVR